MTRRSHLLLLGAGLLLASCATRVQTTGTYLPLPTAQQSATLPRPHRVLVYDFELDPNTVSLDQGLRARLERLNAGQNGAQQSQQIAAEVQAAITDTLVEQIGDMGLTAIHAAPDTRPAAGDVTVTGQVVKINGGNATRRNLIGFGAGKSEVFANVTVSQSVAGGLARPLQTYDADANSGRTPGLGVGAASAAAGQTAAAVAGAAAGTLARARTGLPRDAEHLARRVAVNLGRFFNQQGWIAESAVPSISR